MPTRESRPRNPLPLVRDSTASRFPLSAGQERLWWLRQLDSSQDQYHITVGWKLPAEVNREALLAALSGLAYGPVNPLANYAMQRRSPEQLRGRVVGLMGSSAYAAGPAGFLLAGPLVQWLGVTPAFVLLAAAFLAIALLSAALPILHELDADPATRPDLSL